MIVIIDTVEFVLHDRQDADGAGDNDDDDAKPNA